VQKHFVKMARYKADKGYEQDGSLGAIVKRLRMKLVLIIITFSAQNTASPISPDFEIYAAMVRLALESNVFREFLLLDIGCERRDWEIWAKQSAHSTRCFNVNFHRTLKVEVRCHVLHCHASSPIIVFNTHHTIELNVQHGEHLIPIISRAY
jgi:hypothetical protein